MKRIIATRLLLALEKDEIDLAVSMGLEHPGSIRGPRCCFRIEWCASCAERIRWRVSVGRPALPFKPVRKSSSQQTLCWREMDSNHRYPAKKQL